METLQRTANRGSVSTGYDIDNSLKIEADNAERMQRASESIGTPTSTQKATISLWVKRTELKSSGNHFCWLGNAGATTSFIGFNDDCLRWISDVSNAGVLKSNAVFRDTSAWYHIVFAFDTTQSTASNRIKAYVNGVQITSWSTETYPNQNNVIGIYELNMSHYIGWEDAGQQSGYFAEIYLIDGQQLAPTEFGEFDGDSGIWIPKEYTGTFGNEGYYLDFENSSSLGADVSGNSNNFANLYNITAADQATDTPTNNFCTWSPLWAEPRANGTISEGATQVAWGGNAWKIARSSIAVSKGRWYWEIKGANVTGDTWNNNLFGFASTESDGQTGPSVLLGYSTGNYYYRVASSQTGQDNFGNAGGAWSSSDTFAIALDLESSTKKFILYRNGSAVNGTGTDLVSAFQTEQFFTAYATAYNGDTQFLNWGGYTVNTISSAASDANGYGTFEYAPPSGYYAICTKNLAEFG